MDSKAPLVDYESKPIGVLGGGQLGRMMAEASHRLGVKVIVLDPLGKESPGGQVAYDAIEGSFRDEAKIFELADKCELLTAEIEHINCDSLDKVIEDKKMQVQPAPETIRRIQDKYLQKVHLQKFGIPLPEFIQVDNLEQAYEAGRKFGYPYMLKSRRMAYDGKGNAVVADQNSVVEACAKLGNTDLYAEKWAPFLKELAVMVVRTDDEVRSYPVVETIQKDNICHIVIAPAIGVSQLAMERTSKIASDAIRHIGDGRGIFGVELFLMENDEVLLNEIAPRPHNSGHYTMEGCETDQFENHLRAVANLPLGSCEMRTKHAVMLNILGTGNMKESTDIMDLGRTIPGCGLHWYGKKASSKGRKLAHVTVTADSLSQLKERCNRLGIDLKELNETSSSELTIPTQLNSNSKPVVGIIMGSDSDLPCMSGAAEILDSMQIPYELTIVSAHRTPTRMYEYAQSAANRGIKVIIAGAGGAAHLPGMVAALTSLPVIGVPVKSSTLSGVDSLYSIVQMPRGIPVATVAIGNATNAGLLAARMLGSFMTQYQNSTLEYMTNSEDVVLKKAEKLETEGYKQYHL